MNLLLHQLRTDLRGHRVTVAIALMLALIGPSAGMIIGDRIPGGFGDFVRIGAALLVVIAGAFAIFGGLRETPLAGDRRFWPTRPLPVRTVFLARALWLSTWLAALGIGTWLARRNLHLTPGQLAVTTFLSAGWMGTLVLVSNNLRSVSGDRRAFFSRLTLAIAGFFLSFFLASVVLRATGRSGGPESLILNLVVTFVVTIFLLLVAWSLVAYFRKPRASNRLSFFAILFMPWALSGLLMPEGARHPVPVATPTLTLVEPDEVRSGKIPAGQLLWENLVVRDLEPGQFFVYSEVRTSLNPAGSDKQVTFMQSLPRMMPADGLRAHLGEQPFWMAVKEQLPDGTAWNPAGRSHQKFPLSMGTVERGDLEMRISGVLHRMMPLATIVASHSGRAALTAGGRLSVRKFSVENERLRLHLDAVHPEPEIHSISHPELRRHFQSPLRDNLWCVLFDPRTKEAIGIDPDADRSYRDDHALGLRKQREEFDVPLPGSWVKRLRRSRGGLPDGIELRVFTLQPIAVVPEQTLKRKDYHPEPALPERRRTPELEDFASATLPASPSRDQIDHFLDTVIYSGPDHEGDSPYLPKFRQLPDVALPVLMNRLPVHEDPDLAARTVLARRADALDPRSCLDALRRDPLFIDLCVAKGLDAEAAGIVRPLLRRRQPLQPDVAPTILRIVAEQLPLDGELAADLRWHFVRAGWTQYQVASVLAGLPGFDFDATLAEAWHRFPPGESDHAQRELAAHALRLGDKEALRLTLLKLRGRLREGERERTLALLTERLDGGESPAWAERHFADLRFDPETRRFMLR